MNAVAVIDELKRRFPNEPEYIQAVEEVLTTIEDVYNENPEFDRYNLIERLCIPDRIFCFPCVVGRRQRQGSQQHGLPCAAQQCHRSLQGRYPFPLIGQSVNPQVPRFRADFQELTHHTRHGRCQRW